MSRTGDMAIDAENKDYESRLALLMSTLQNIVDDSYSLAGNGPLVNYFRCHQCEALKGDLVHPHAEGCSVGRAEVVLMQMDVNDGIKHDTTQGRWK